MGSGHRGRGVLPKIVPRVSVAKYRVPVPPTVTGSALAKYELTGWVTVLPQTVVPPMAWTPDAASSAIVTL